MTTDRYMKAVFTVIAIALSVIALRMSFSDIAVALSGDCGSRASNPCYVDSGYSGLSVRVTNWPMQF